MGKIIITSCTGKTVDVTRPVENWKEEYIRYVDKTGKMFNDIQPKDITYDEYLSFITEKDCSHGLSRVSVDAELPTSNNYRAAWIDTGSVIDIDLDKAKEVHMNQIKRLALIRAPRDILNQPDLTIITKEIEAIDLDSITDLQTLYKTFPASIDRHGKDRPEYETHDTNNYTKVRAT